MDSPFCTVHEKQALVLFCLEDKTQLCLKCVSKHAGHTILDFEDVCKQFIGPKINQKKQILSDLKTRNQREKEQLEEQVADIKQFIEKGSA